MTPACPLSARLVRVTLRPVIGGAEHTVGMQLTPSRGFARGAAAWLVPVLVAGIVVLGGGLLEAPTAGAHPKLPQRTALQLLTAVQSSTVTALSGTVIETARLGLPALPGADSSASLSWQSLAVGTHTARVWIDGTDRQRLAVLGTLSESDVIHNGRDLWTYRSQTNDVSHRVLPPATGAETGSPEPPGAPPLTPAAAAAQLLKSVDPSTAVTVESTEIVAGRAAYTLVLTPRDTGTTVRRVEIAIEAGRYLPLRVAVFGSGPSAALETGFTAVSFSTPPSSIFDFRVPRGASVTPDPFGDTNNADMPQDPNRPRPAAPKVIGSGWTSIIELSASPPFGSSGGLLDKATRPVGVSGDRILETTLVNVLILHDGRVFLGAVTPQTLERAAATTPR
jgi:outer membrane lipoprotein-sorting protein